MNAAYKTKPAATELFTDPERSIQALKTSNATIVPSTPEGYCPSSSTHVQPNIYA